MKYMIGTLCALSVCTSHAMLREAAIRQAMYQYSHEAGEAYKQLRPELKKIVAHATFRERRDFPIEIGMTGLTMPGVWGHRNDDQLKETKIQQTWLLVNAISQEMSPEQMRLFRMAMWAAQNTPPPEYNLITLMPRCSPCDALLMMLTLWFVYQSIVQHMSASSPTPLA